MAKTSKVEKVTRIRGALKLAKQNDYYYENYSRVVKDFHLACIKCQDATVARKFTSEQLDEVAAAILSDLNLR